ncbi:MAG: hypothetical protein IPK19_27820 [Chloroflexi bacterium]|nr:hypothetical protein [Chloroflexota bacterium]
MLDLLDQFATDASQMGRLDIFGRVYDAMALVKKMGVSARALLRAATNDPAADSVRELQAGVRARYDASAWRDVIRPISDQLRGLKRDALVAYILHMMRSNPASVYIDMG